MYGNSITKQGSLIDVGVDIEIVKKSGAWFTYEGEQLGQGRENARQFLAEHADVAQELERRIREAVGLTGFGAEDEVVGVAALEAGSEGQGAKNQREPTGVPAG